MLDLLLITDIPRIRKIFSRMAEDNAVKVRIANNLEKGAEEIVVQKPSAVFVQAHLSGLSAEIILMHLKKQLGRKRTRFILLATLDNVSQETLNTYHGYIDVSASDDTIQQKIRDIIETLQSKPVKKTVQNAEEDKELAIHSDILNAVTANSLEKPSVPEIATTLIPLTLPDLSGKPCIAVLPESPVIDPTPVEQGIAYPARTRLSVYSEFNSSFDSVVQTMDSPATVTEAVKEQNHAWQEHIQEISLSDRRSNKRNFAIWLIPVVVIVVAITYFQQKYSNPSPVALKNPAVPEVKPALPVSRPVPVDSPAVAVSSPERLPVVTTPVTPPTPAVIPEKNTSLTRLTNIPDFVPRSGYDKNYGKENPGWELYKGRVTEFKILRDNDGIKAIQVVDRGGNGVPESFMRGVIGQLIKKPKLEVTASEKKDGYEIQRGRYSANEDVVFYRDADGGKLRGFVVTWK